MFERMSMGHVHVHNKSTFKRPVVYWAACPVAGLSTCNEHCVTVIPAAPAIPAPLQERKVS
jgi:hypothetical protein